MIKYHEVSPRWEDPTTWESVSVIISCKCRQCDACLRKKRIHWYHRAKLEIDISPRTWFGTLTYAPDVLLCRQITAERSAKRKGCDWASLSASDRFKALLAECSTDVTLALKRLRKVSPGVLRHLVVSEQHQSGAPHFHILIHEADTLGTTHAKLKACWTAGFSHFKLADPKAAGYVAKYISKDASARVRASQHYGYGPSVTLVRQAPGAEADGSEEDVKKLSLGRLDRGEEGSESEPRPAVV